MVLGTARSCLAFLLDAVVETIYPEFCVRCQARPHQVPWCDNGPVTDGLRPFDRPHLCRECLADLPAKIPVLQERELGGGINLRFMAAGRTTSELTKVVGAWKYHGLRGLAWPLAGLLAEVLRHTQTQGLELGTLVPVPLHGRRRRSRGFNQAALLSCLATGDLDIPVSNMMVKRIRNTGQQALLDSPEDRRENLVGSFAAIPPPKGQDRRLTLVDDLVTSGSTTGELAQTLREAGWVVGLVVALGLAGQKTRG